MEPFRVLHIVSAMNRGGVETLLMNVYRNLDRSNVQFDFVSHQPYAADYDDEIEQLGGRVHRIPSLGKVGPISYIRNLMRIYSRHTYRAVHVHTDFQSGFPALAAKWMKIERRICHSHSSNWLKGQGFTARMTLTVLKGLVKYAATDLCACSAEAASFLFGEKMLQKDKFRILKNGIDLKEFMHFDHEICALNVKEELAIPHDAILIGHVGKFSASKNQLFILQLLQKLLKDHPRYYVVMAGEGPYQDAVKMEAIRLGVDQHVFFVGARDDVPRWMKAFDVFVFPSLFEGFGIVTIEAQGAGTPCVASDAVPRSTDLGIGLISYVSLQEDPSTWCREIIKAIALKRPENHVVATALAKSGLLIHDVVRAWLAMYGISQKYG